MSGMYPGTSAAFAYAILLDQNVLLLIINSDRFCADECENDQPLDEQRKEILTNNYANMVELLECEELVNMMYSKRCISRHHKESIQAKATSFDQNEQLLDILFLRSIADFNAFICCLEETRQSHLAQYFKVGGGTIFILYCILFI